MIGGGWPELSRGRLVVLVLALIGFVWLLRQTQPDGIQLSRWSGLTATGAESQTAQPQAQALTGRGLPVSDGDTPFGNPLQQRATLLTQGYGVGSHAPAAIWGGVDLALDGNRDGSADPRSTLGAPIYATQSGTAVVRPDTWPAGNYLAITSAHYKIAFAHLSRYAVEDGQAVRRGQVVGYVGTTGSSTGPHLHYEVWKDGENVNPLDYGALDGTGK